jgi:hypothetical protein
MKKGVEKDMVDHTESMLLVGMRRMRSGVNM